MMGIAVTKKNCGGSHRGLSAASIGKRCVVYLALDTAASAAKAVAIIKKIR
jgi:hypothetical protein